MLFVDNEEITDPRLNLAIEEYLLRNVKTDDDILLFYINEPSIIVGRHQNTLEEVNMGYVRENDIHVVRRLSGGGAVYHDLGNLNFSFTTSRTQENMLNFKKFTEPVIRVLHKMGVPAALSGRNDILVEDRKISGNAQYIAGRRMVTHGTLLFDTDLTVLSKALNVSQRKIQSKGIKSVRSRVANLIEYLDHSMDVYGLREQLLTGIFNGAGEIPQVHLDEADWHAIRKLSQERYRQWTWNFGASPDFNLRKRERFSTGEIDAHIDVHGGAIRAIKFYGDFMGMGDLAALEERLIGVAYNHESLAEILQEVDLNEIFGAMTREAFLEFLF
jgi:lipoate-protein ligase A